MKMRIPLVFLFIVILCLGESRDQENYDVQADELIGGGERQQQQQQEQEQQGGKKTRKKAYHTSSSSNRIIRPGYGRETHPCDHSSCFPDTGNLLIGRETRLSATSTCGLQRKVSYCIVSHLKDKKNCFWCDSRPRMDGNTKYSHKISNIIYKLDPKTQKLSWWQSENGVEFVSIQLDLEAEFHFTHLIMTFRSFRPAAMVIERSFDFGRTWKVYRYFAYDCSKMFPAVQRGVPTSINDVVCESRYSAVEPSTEGEVIFRALPTNIAIANPYSDEVRDLLKITNLRVNLTKLHALGDQLLDSRDHIKGKYFYAIYNMVVRGSCSCYGHASRCLPLSGVENRPGMVNGHCECTHSTKGPNCKECQDFYNDLPWKAAVGKKSNACKMCNCNNHSSSCHFDRDVYEATGNVSGGVCDNCAHNTRGRNCEECVSYFYQDPNSQLTDPSICQPCNCDTRGSVENGTCDSRSDSASNLLAGRCHCKVNVDGLKCDHCKAGYWNLTEENPQGCRVCMCHPLGTVKNQSCSVVSGQCTCKPSVVGRDCSQCLPQYYGLTEQSDGCRPCLCDHGGALDNDCHTLTGQCKCRPHVTGRRCDAPEEGFYVAALNHLTYEAELATKSNNCQLVMQTPDGRETTWTGPGFVRVCEHSFLVFDVQGIVTTMKYDLVIRYQPHFLGEWENVLVTIQRPGPINPDGGCAKTRSTDDQMLMSLLDNRQYMKSYQSVCLEKNKQYKVRIDFQKSNTESPSASVLIDSIVLIPLVETINFYFGSVDNENRYKEYEKHKCSESFYGMSLANVSKVCKDNHLVSIGLFVFGQAYACECDRTGSRSSICSLLGGQCACKTSVTGRRCNQCALGTYGFGPEGCKGCACNYVGALDNFCNQQTGQCKCHPNKNGRQCDKCRPGFWNFPKCQSCECHGHALTCDAHSGVCHACQDNTAGPNCAMCMEGFYGDPRLKVGITCRPCACPGTVKSGHNFASQCSLNPRSKDVVCECREGYAGSRCHVCADNYYGNPHVPGGRCQPCQCNNNVDIAHPGSCDPSTGECQGCLFNTFGFHCERCKPGFYGDALKQECKECECNLLGTNCTIEVCDHETGQCPCLPNVLGVQCDRCAPNHWKITSYPVCEECACDSIGSKSEQCNKFDGQCQCREGFGGRRCNRCEKNYYGDPMVECLPCNCSNDGSRSLQCDYETGKCDCREGFIGEKCDKCLRGYTRQPPPHCQKCGECFDNWDDFLVEMKEKTEKLITIAEKIKRTGTPGAYSYEFALMEENIEHIRNILLSANFTSNTISSLKEIISKLGGELQEALGSLGNLTQDVDSTSQRISLATNALDELHSQTEELSKEAKDLQNKARSLRSGNVGGAAELTHQAKERSMNAQDKVQLTEAVISESKQSRRRVETLLLHAGDSFNNIKLENEAKLAELNGFLEKVENSLSDLNHVVCGRSGSPCDALCGGAGCGKCGGFSCNDGLMEIVNNAFKFMEDGRKELKKKEAEADKVVRRMVKVKNRSLLVLNLIKMSVNLPLQALNISDAYKKNITNLLKEIKELKRTGRDNVNKIKMLAEQVLNTSISVKPEDLKALSEIISGRVDCLINIDTIINETKNKQKRAKRLKGRAEESKGHAEYMTGVAERVKKALQEAAVMQDQIEMSITNSSDVIEAIQTWFTQITNNINVTWERANASVVDVRSLNGRERQVQTDHLVNQRRLDDTNKTLDQVNLKIKKTVCDSKELENRYQKTVTLLDKKFISPEDMRTKAEELKRSANELAYKAKAKLDSLNSIQTDFNSNENQLMKFEKEIIKMEKVMAEKLTNILSQTNCDSIIHPDNN